MRMAKYICRFQLLALAMLLVVLISAPSSANADKVMVNKDKELDEAYWQEFLSTPFTDPQSPTGIKENEHQRELAYTYGYDYPGEICDHSGFLQVDHVGVEKCIGRDQGLCKDGWEFGIYRKGGSYFVQLRKESDRNNPVYKRYGGAKELCIGERPGNVAYMSIKFDHGTQYLFGKDVGSSKHRLPRLKIRPQEGKCRGDNKDGRRMLGKCDNEVIVKYRDGAGDDDCLWEVFFDGRTNTCSGSGWGFMPWPDCQANVDMACVATRTSGGEPVDCDNIPKCDMTAPSCEWTLQWNYKITNKCQNPAEIENFETTLCHGHCHVGMSPYDGCLEESNPDCSTYGLADITITPSGRTIDAGGTKVASVNSWTIVDLSMEGAKIYGNSTVVLNTTESIVRSGEASKCIDLCDKVLMNRAEDTGGISNGENAVIVDSIITDEDTLEQDEADRAGGISNGDAPVSPDPTQLPTISPTDTPVSPDPTQLPTISPTNAPVALKQDEADRAGGISNGENAVIVDSIITDEETLATLPVSVIPTSTPTVNQESNKSPQTDMPTDALNIIAETNTNPVPCKVSAVIGCAVSHNGKLIECQNFRKSSQDMVEIQWTYSIINGCEHPIKAHRAKIMKCHKCPTLTSTNGQNSCTSDTNFFKEAKGGQDITISGSDSFQFTEYDTVNLTVTCNLSPLISSLSRFIAMRISAGEGVELLSSQVTAANSLGPVCKTGGGPFPGSLSCETENLWEDAPNAEKTENGSL